MSIRTRLLTALLIFSVLAAGIGGYAIVQIENSAGKTVETYNKPFMAINFTRSALNAFASMEKALARFQVAQLSGGPSGGGSDPGAGSRHLGEIDTLYERFLEDLDVAERRASSAKAAATMTSVRERVAQWNDNRIVAVMNGITPREWDQLDAMSREIFREFDYLADQIAGDGFILRQDATRSIEEMRGAAAVALVLIVVAALLIGWLLARSLLRPLSVAVGAAERIARGELTGDIPESGSGETNRLLKSMANMQTALREIMAREEELRRSAQMRLGDAIESSSEGIVLLDDNAEVQIANTEMLAFFRDVSGDFGVGRSFYAVLDRMADAGLIAPQDAVRLAGSCRTAAADGHCVTDVNVADGRWLRFRFSRAQERGIVVIAADITDFIRREEQIDSARKQAEAASRAKTEFLANMSHELRTPLNAVIGFSQIMKDEALGPLGNDEYRVYATDIHESGEHLLNIINDILDLSKIEVGRMDLEIAPFDAAGTIESCLRMLAGRAAKGGVELVFESGDGPLRATADQRLFKQILMNLLSNAIKFTPAGGRISVSAGASADGGLAVTVRDTGIGMSREEVALAEQPFGQVDGALNRKFEGTGLGVPLTRRMIELHGGTMRIDSTPGEGTAVGFTLPVPEPPAAAGPVDRHRAAAGRRI